MPLESATYVKDLVATNPASGDGAGLGDDHIRLVKASLRATFVNLNGAVNGTPWQFNAATGSFSTTLNDTKLTLAPQTLVSTVRGGGIKFSAGAGASTFFEAYTDSNFWGVYGFPVAGGAATSIISLDAGGNFAASGQVVAGSAVTATTSVTAGTNVNATSGKVMEGGNALIPAGVIVMWAGTVAPAGWKLCDGTLGTPDLRGRFVIGNSGTYPYATSGGAASWTGATAAGGGGALTGSVGPGGDHNHGANTGSYTLQITDIPSHTHGVTDPGHTHWTNATTSGVSGSGIGDRVDGFAPVAATINSATTGITVGYTGGGGGHIHSITSSGTHTHSITLDPVGTHTHTVTVPTLPPYFALAFIMKS